MLLDMSFSYVHGCGCWQCWQRLQKKEKRAGSQVRWCWCTCQHLPPSVLAVSVHTSNSCSEHWHSEQNRSSHSGWFTSVTDVSSANRPSAQNRSFHTSHCWSKSSVFTGHVHHVHNINWWIFLFLTVLDRCVCNIWRSPDDTTSARFVCTSPCCSVKSWL